MTDSGQKWTTRTISVVARSYLEQCGVPAPRLDSELLLAHVLGCTRLQLFMDFDRPLTSEEVARYREAVRQRGVRVPLQYITGEAEFMSLSFKVTPAVMIPRPETEFVVEEAIRCLRSLQGTGVHMVCRQGVRDSRSFTLPKADAPEKHSAASSPREGELPLGASGDAASGEMTRKEPCSRRVSEAMEVASPVVVDIGTGCGNIAVAIAKNVPAACVFATDISPGALSIARENAARHGVDSRITFVEGDLFSPLRKMGLGHAVTLVVSNPPYVDARETQTLQPEVLKEPREAVFAGDDALVFYRRIGYEAVEMLMPGGHIVLEVGSGQAQAVQRLLESTGAYEAFRTQKDLAGIDRVLTARRVR